MTDQELLTLKRAAQLYLTVFTTRMSQEFPEVVPEIGETYALLGGETQEVASAIKVALVSYRAGR